MVNWIFGIKFTCILKRKAILQNRFVTDQEDIGIPYWLRWLRACPQFWRHEFDPWVWKTPWRKKWQPIPVFLPGKSHGWRSLAGYSPQDRKELDTTEWLHFHFSLSSRHKKNSNNIVTWKKWEHFFLPLPPVRAEDCSVMNKPR